MALVLLVRPSGLFGTPSAAATPAIRRCERAADCATDARRAPRGIARAHRRAAAAAGDEYALILAIDILIAALFAASLRLITGVGGITSFGHAAYFGIGAYASALAARPWLSVRGARWRSHRLPRALAALAFGALCVRLSGIYLAMLTLAFAQIVWSIALQWDAVTGGSNGITGVWPPDWLADRTRYYAFVLVAVAGEPRRARVVAFTPFGYALRGSRDSPLRAAASGIDVRARRIKALAIAGLRRAGRRPLRVSPKAARRRRRSAIPRSVDALVMMLLGGQNALFGPLLGAAAFTWLQDTLARATEYWRASVGVVILLIVSVFPFGIGGAAVGAWLAAASARDARLHRCSSSSVCRSRSAACRGARRVVRRRGRRDRRDHRAQRRRQDDVLQPDPRRARAGSRRRSLDGPDALCAGRPTRSRAAASAARSRWPRPSLDDGARKRRAGACRA